MDRFQTEFANRWQMFTAEEIGLITHGLILGDEDLIERTLIVMLEDKYDKTIDWLLSLLPKRTTSKTIIKVDSIN